MLSKENVLLALPFAVAVLCFSFHITGDLYGDEFATYRWAVLGEPLLMTGKPASVLSINFTLAKLGHMIVGAPWGIRLPSLIFALATVVMVGKLARLLFGEKQQLIAMWLTALSPILIEFAAEARPYAILAFFGTAFLYYLLKFERDENWNTATLLGVVSALGCLSRIIFAANLLFGVTYYLWKRKKVTKYAIVAALIVIPVIVRLLMLFYMYESKAPKIAEGAVGVSTINFILRAGVAYNFGYSTFSLPDLGAERNVPVLSVLKENIPAIALIMVAAVGICFGTIWAARKHPRAFLFLLASIVIPSAGIIITGQLGYTIVREKYLMGVLGGYLVLLSVIFGELIGRNKSRISAIAFLFVLGISLFHYFGSSEDYSRRMYPSALNQEIISLTEQNDVIVAYHIRRSVPNYYTILDGDYRYLDVRDDIPEGMTLEAYADQMERDAGDKIFLISAEGMRNMVDPENIILKSLKLRRNWERKKYGRNLSLYVFSNNL